MVHLAPLFLLFPLAMPHPKYEKCENFNGRYGTSCVTFSDFFPIEAPDYKCEKCNKSDVQVASKKTSGLERLVQPCPSM